MCKIQVYKNLELAQIQVSIYTDLTTLYSLLGEQ